MLLGVPCAKYKYPPSDASWVHMAKEMVCDVDGCDGTAVRSLPGGKVKGALDMALRDTGKRIHLCKAHYREYKRITKKDRKLERLGW